jgi:hypothetical protein
VGGEQVGMTPERKRMIEQDERVREQVRLKSRAVEGWTKVATGLLFFLSVRLGRWIGGWQGVVIGVALFVTPIAVLVRMSRKR